MTLTRKMIARLDESTGQMGTALERMLVKYGPDDDLVLDCSEQLGRRFKLLSYLMERAETR